MLNGKDRCQTSLTQNAINAVEGIARFHRIINLNIGIAAKLVRMKPPYISL